MAISEAAREPGSSMPAPNGKGRLYTACGHSLATCWTSRCFRLPPTLRAERDRLLTAAKTEHHKNLTREDARYAQEQHDIETTYLDLAAEHPS